MLLPLLLVAAASSARAAEPAGLIIRDYAFEPARLAVEAGATVSVHNGDAEPHAMRTTDGALTFVAAVGPNGTVEFTAPTTAGEYRYYCPFHTRPDATNATFMRGVLVVNAANPTADTTPATSGTRAVTGTTPTHADPAFETWAALVAVVTVAALARRRARG